MASINGFGGLFLRADNPKAPAPVIRNQRRPPPTRTSSPAIHLASLEPRKVATVLGRKNEPNQ